MTLRERITLLAEAIGVDVKWILCNLEDPEVTPERGWILQHDGECFKPSFRKILISESLDVTTSNVEANALKKISESINVQRVGTYRVTPIYNWSIDATNSDINVKGFFDGSPISEVVSEKIHKKEGKDAAGNDDDGRGTTQIDSFCGAYHIQVDSIGLKLVELEFYPDNNGVEASMFEASLLIEEIFI